ncbi:hypothetical protein GCM10008967_35920 [Bacillus carboniphilus]|uniref:Uncharacterized protein n=1 Tax=Bacillus carboniphilus TaxID=86663 RepID=A0ABP3GFB9_9BACI
MTTKWARVLEIVCDKYFTANTSIEWILVGSAGSVLQGCEMEPGDIDIYVRDANGVAQFAELLKEYALPTKCESRQSHEWFSSVEEPVFSETFPFGFAWSKARFKIDGFEVEVVHISDSAGIPDNQTGDGIWEGGQYIWELAKQVKVGEYSIPTVPLEIQLESNLRRKRQDRADAILKKLKNDGFDAELLGKSLSKQHLSKFYESVK